MSVKRDTVFDNIYSSMKTVAKRAIKISKSILDREPD